MSGLFHELDPLKTGLDVASLRHRILAGNLANLNTPGYVRSDVKFEELLREQLQNKSGAQSFRDTIAGVRPKVVLDPSGPATPDGNNVTVERETGQIGRNEILYSLYAEILSSKLSQLRFVIGATK